MKKITAHITLTLVATITATAQKIQTIDKNGNYAPEDFVMLQLIDSYDHTNEDGTNEQRIIALEVFTTDRAYVTKNELKQIKKNNKTTMNYRNIIQLENKHHIPPMAQAVQKRLAELWSK